MQSGSLASHLIPKPNYNQTWRYGIYCHTKSTIWLHASHWRMSLLRMCLFSDQSPTYVSVDEFVSLTIIDSMLCVLWVDDRRLVSWCHIKWTTSYDITKSRFNLWQNKWYTPYKGTIAYISNVLKKPFLIIRIDYTDLPTQHTTWWLDDPTQ